MKFLIEIDCDNAAFQDDAGLEVANILSNVAQAVAGGERGLILLDSNGNSVGKAFFQP